MNPIKRGVSRRTFLKGASSLAAMPFLSGLGGMALTGYSSSATAASRQDRFNTKLVILGSSGGVSYWQGSTRASSSSALVVNGTIYLIDLGQGATARLNQAFNSNSVVNANGSYKENPSSTFLTKVKALFFTHLHQDHVADYANLLLIGAGAGLGSPSQATGLATNPLKVIGPCNRGQQDNNNSPYITPGTIGSWIVSTDSSNPALITRTPGTIQMTNLILGSFAQAVNDIMLDDGYPNYRTLVEVSEIGRGLETPYSPTCPATDPFQVYPSGGGADENGVSVLATLVDHHQVYPAFAFRFNTPEGSVVFSGDTGPNTTANRNLVEGDAALADGNLQHLAAGADVLVHEVIDTAWVEKKFGKYPDESSPAYALKNHMLTAHTQIERVGQVAEFCGVKTLVLNHIVPGMAPTSHLKHARRNFSGNLIIGADLMRIRISKFGGSVL
ncbi:MAG TPA: MBL fold metallo-hydrolase [Thermodesulfovibrionales bacterium]|nr:MBL fold metallo-hydrolase [Thermodesulfovibrionales bacterium]